MTKDQELSPFGVIPPPLRTQNLPRFLLIPYKASLSTIPGPYKPPLFLSKYQMTSTSLQKIDAKFFRFMIDEIGPSLIRQLNKLVIITLSPWHRNANRSPQKSHLLAPMLSGAASIYALLGLAIWYCQTWTWGRKFLVKSEVDNKTL